MVYLNPQPDWQAEDMARYEEVWHRDNPAAASQERLLNRDPETVWRWARWPYRLFNKAFHRWPFGPGEGRRVLDIGCGGGEDLVSFLDRGWRIYGLDINRMQIRFLQEHVEGEFFCGYLQDAAYPDDFFDLVRLDNVLEHIPEPKLLLEEVHRILKPGGQVLTYVPNVEGFSYHLLGRYAVNWWVPFHVNMFSRRTLRRLLEDCSLRVCQMICLMPITHLFLSWRQYQHRADPGYPLDYTPPGAVSKLLLTPLTLALRWFRWGDELFVVAGK
jgi:SAM-dependent methyltransferase